MFKRSQFKVLFPSWLTYRFTSFRMSFRLNLELCLFLNGVYIYTDLASSDFIYVYFISPNRFKDYIFCNKYKRLLLKLYSENLIRPNPSIVATDLYPECCASPSIYVLLLLKASTCHFLLKNGQDLHCQSHFAQTQREVLPSPPLVPSLHQGILANN